MTIGDPDERSALAVRGRVRRESRHALVRVGCPSLRIVRSGPRLRHVEAECEAIALVDAGLNHVAVGGDCPVRAKRRRKARHAALQRRGWWTAPRASSRILSAAAAALDTRRLRTQLREDSRDVTEWELRQRRPRHVSQLSWNAECAIDELVAALGDEDCCAAGAGCDVLVE